MVGINPHFSGSFMVGDKARGRIRRADIQEYNRLRQQLATEYNGIPVALQLKSSGLIKKLPGNEYFRVNLLDPANPGTVISTFDLPKRGRKGIQEYFSQAINFAKDRLANNDIGGIRPSLLRAKPDIPAAGVNPLRPGTLSKAREQFAAPETQDLLNNLPLGSKIELRRSRLFHKKKLDITLVDANGATFKTTITKPKGADIRGFIRDGIDHANILAENTGANIRAGVLSARQIAEQLEAYEARQFDEQVMSPLQAFQQKQHDINISVASTSEKLKQTDALRKEYEALLERIQQAERTVQQAVEDERARLHPSLNSRGTELIQKKIDELRGHGVRPNKFDFQIVSGQALKTGLDAMESALYAQRHQERNVVLRTGINAIHGTFGAIRHPVQTVRSINISALPGALLGGVRTAANYTVVPVVNYTVVRPAMGVYGVGEWAVRGIGRALRII